MIKRSREPTPGKALERAPDQFIAFLRANRAEITEQWVHQTSCLGPHYRTRTIAELEHTIGQSFEANLASMAQADPEPLHVFVEYITELRLKAGFFLSEVQKAFDLFRIILIPRLCGLGHPWTGPAASAVNACVSYQIHQFSDRFQRMHQQAIQQHAQDLEREVELRSQELAVSQRRYKTLVEEINDGYFVVDQGRVAFANRAFARLHQARTQQIASQLFEKFVAPGDRERVAAAYQALWQGGSLPPSLQYERLDLDGVARPTEMRARLADLGQGPVVIGICRDLTDRLAMEAKVREHERMAYVGQLTASLSHEIRNPLAIINVNLQVLSRKPYLEAVDQERLSMAVGEVSRLEQLLRQLLDVAKPLAPALALGDLNHLAQDCLKLLETQLAQRGIRVRRQLAAGLGPVAMDQNMLEQALINLLLNAMEALGQGGSITVGTGEEDSLCLLWVRDNGPGLSPQDLAHVFTPFYTNKRQGTGLGLTNVQRIAQAHQGSVRVESRPGRGAKFTLLLPREA